MDTRPYKNPEPYKNPDIVGDDWHRAQFNERDKSMLGNYLRVAAERFDDHAKVFRQMIDTVPANPHALMQLSGDAAKRMAEQFEHQAAEARQYAEVFENSHQILDILYDAS